MRLYFMRHGETDYNRQRKFYGTTDVGINEVGRHQCREVETKLAATRVDQILTSSRRRTHESAAIIFPNRQYDQALFLDEWGFGRWEGLDADQIQAQFPVKWERWLADPFGYTPPEAEPYAIHEARIIDGFNQFVTASQQKTVALVTHLGTIRVILHHLFPDREFWDITLTQGHYTCLEMTDGTVKVIEWDR
ncbi:histidine phosphatase family protein [Secundilactobacillus kimchicus]|uniref:histidine phosphatase family protein n=1 Tax=Secundilactobacillus kimchicus TaxID=528209 RepID=UPI001C025DB2|nr:histidine phosphatase family protein [Secundilactobacillus kimchicus]MBT9672397.1 histidine phosphatase family protein [Secundilactobacillus kimchicus]